MKKPYGIGIDIGGTKISVILGTERGVILEKEVIATPRGKEVRRAFARIRDIGAGMLEKRGIPRARLRGVGVGVPGIFDSRSKVILESPNLKSWIGINLEKAFKKSLSVPVWIENDANATAVAEKLFGEGRETSNFIYITVSTGIGSGIIIDNKLYRGSGWSAGEVGHTIVNPEGQRNAMGIPGTLEFEASGTAIARKANARRRGRKTLLEKGATAKEVKEAALKGDRLAGEILDEAGEYLGIGLSNLIMLFNPEKIILGGSVLKGGGGDRILGSARRSLKRYAWAEPLRKCRIVKTRRIDEIADLGALGLVFYTE